MRIVRTAICGSFRRQPEELRSIYNELAFSNCQILSPFSLDFTDTDSAFVQTKEEKTLSPAEIERRHLAAMAHADFVWLHCPGGYLGVSGAFELGFAHAKGVPIFSKSKPNEPGIESFVRIYSSVYEALFKNGLA